MKLAHWSVIALALLVVSCASLPIVDHRLPRWTDAMSDGCTLPVPLPVSVFTAAETQCCIAHDAAYYRGGSELARLVADEALRVCVKATGLRGELIADGMFNAVRVGGGPELKQPWSWAFGGQRFVYSLFPAEMR
jgi:hypothetical protein